MCVFHNYEKWSPVKEKYWDIGIDLFVEYYQERYCIRCGVYRSRQVDMVQQKRIYK
jgi:hypothetical protein